MYNLKRKLIMDTTFEIGEVVVCTNAKRRWYKLGGLIEGEMYTVEGFNPIDDGLILKESKSPSSGYNAYSADRFRKVDYSFANNILDDIQSQERENVEFVPMPLQRFFHSLFNLS